MNDAKALKVWEYSSNPKDRQTKGSSNFDEDGPKRNKKRGFMKSIRMLCSKTFTYQEGGV